MKTDILLIDAHQVELHDAFLSFVPEVFPSASFRRWYELNGWSPDYRAFAIMEGGRIVANVSVQRMDLTIGGRARTGWQLGAVGVLPEQRGRGLQRVLLNHLLEQLDPRDMTFLFANEEVLDFYPRFGFRRAQEWIYSIDRSVRPASGAVRRLSVDSGEDRDVLARIAATAAPVTERFGARGYGSLLLWYWSNVPDIGFYYHPGDDSIVVAERDMEVLRILDVLARTPVDLADYFPQLVSEPVDHIEFAFTPERVWPDAVPDCEYRESLLFVRGDVPLPPDPFKFPVLAQT
jgi:GNAT superfamily N-acetyltransferase